MTLSKRAVALLDRVRAGRFYRPHSPDLPAAMAELEKAGLVSVCDRPVEFVAAYVPTTGYTPFVPERYEPPQPAIFVGLEHDAATLSALSVLLALSGACVERRGARIDRVTIPRDPLTTEGIHAVGVLRAEGIEVVEA